MANKGQGLMSEATWNEMHAEDAPDYDYMFYCKFENNLSIYLDSSSKKNYSCVVSWVAVKSSYITIVQDLKEFRARVPKEPIVEIINNGPMK